MYKDVIKRVSEELGLPYDLVDRTYKAYWLFIKEKIKSWPLHTDLTKEEFDTLRTSINIPCIGKMGVTWDRYQAFRNRYKRLTNENKENQASVQQGDSDS